MTQIPNTHPYITTPQVTLSFGDHMTQIPNTHPYITTPQLTMSFGSHVTQILTHITTSGFSGTSGLV